MNVQVYAYNLRIIIHNSFDLSLSPTTAHCLSCYPDLARMVVGGCSWYAATWCVCVCISSVYMFCGLIVGKLANCSERWITIHTLSELIGSSGLFVRG